MKYYSPIDTYFLEPSAYVENISSLKMCEAFLYTFLQDVNCFWLIKT